MTCLAQMAQRAVAGHIAGMVQERSHSAPSNAAALVAPGHEEHQAASTENPVHVEETSLPQPKSVQTPRDSPRVQVPVDLLDNPARIEADIRIDPNFSVWLDSWHRKFNWVYGMSA